MRLPGFTGRAGRDDTRRRSPTVVAGCSLGADDGTTLIEVIVALSLLVVVAAGLLSMDALATKVTENYGHLSARATEYAQDKMEQLLVLAYGDEETDTTVFPSRPEGGTGLMIGGSVDPLAPEDGYVDYLDQSGDLVTGVDGGIPDDWYYQRLWQVTSPADGLKQVTVTVAVRYAFAGGQRARSTLTALKAFPF